MRFCVLTHWAILVVTALLAGVAVEVQGSEQPGGGENVGGKGMQPIYLPRKRCEICVTVMMRKMAQAPHLCSGLEHYFETCNDVIASSLHWYPNLIYWSWSGGCDRQDDDGTITRIRPCPAHAICSWLTSPNYHVPFCPWDPAFKAPGLEDSVYPVEARPSDNLPKLGGVQGLAYLPGLGSS